MGPLSPRESNLSAADPADTHEFLNRRTRRLGSDGHNDPAAVNAPMEILQAQHPAAVLLTQKFFKILVAYSVCFDKFPHS
jgi:hypothetical protein